ncbi:pfs domain-containing protein [Trichoderma compactum]
MALLQLSGPRQYTVGIITALDKELAAVMAVLDEKHWKPQKFKKHPEDTNTYTWGRIGEHNVVIASLAAGSYGTVSAATTASSMISSLPHIRFGLMVGIGAGVPRLEDKIDIRLGDVVVSQPTGTSPGVVQYDLGKLRKDGKFERVGHLSAPPEAEHLMEDPQILTILEDMVQRYPKMKEPGENGASSFIHRGMENDRLFMASSIHIDIPITDGTASEQDSACAQCDSTKEIKLKDLFSKPAIHYGVIASGNSRCICFEMEAAGLMNNFPCLVITGICDYADAHTNDRWQNYAAATAAVFAKELLNIIAGEDVESTPPIEEAIQHLGQEVAQMAESSRQTHTVVQTLETSHHLQKLCRWLSPPNPSENYNNGIKHRYGDSGIPGCGKTVLSAIIVKDLEDNNANSVLYLFFDFTNRDKRLFDKALGSLVLQLYCKNDNTQKPLDSLYDSCGKGITQPITARPEQDITSSIESWARSQDIVPLRSGRVAGDILAYIKARLDALENCLDYPTLRKALNSLPMTLDETYARILTNLRREHEHYARRPLQFLTQPTAPGLIQKNRMPVPKEIISYSYCSSLVVLTVKTTVKARGDEEAMQELQPAHLSVKDYLLSDRAPQSFAKDFNEAAARASIAQVCLAYLLELDKSFPAEELRRSCWLAQYSARYWMDHAVMVESSSKEVCALIAEFVSCEGLQITCYGLYNPDHPWKDHILQPRRYDTSSALYCDYGGNALYAASYYRRDKVVQMLLDKGANVDARGGKYGTALNAASSPGYDEIAQMLRDKGARTESEETESSFEYKQILYYKELHL